MTRRGFTLLELLTAMTLGAVALTIGTKMFIEIHGHVHRLETAMFGLEASSRFLSDLKRDLRGATSVAVVEGSGLDVTVGGKTRRYRFDAKSGDVTTDDGRGYFNSFERVAFTDAGALVVVELELMRERGTEKHAPVIATRVFCRGRKP
jgi:prepilin-type N-terminal cleavage/methylation domain-containing protein